ncbi:VOC family protein [Selenomonas ruminantium]|uniref:SMU1112c/YaeR family gloxylase I-like metalloprotein n=1 Tax=Selenomonas ruminantium TaxID=971 RepID=UPI0026EB6E1F|nr:VOC family protein [Selenomonas ruminantium]
MCDKLNLTHIHHVAIIGSNYERSRHFYVDILGFAVIRENYREAQQDWKIDLRLADAELELFIKEGCPKRAGWPGKEAYGLRHLAFRVDSVDDTVRKLNALGVETEPIRCDTFTGEKMTFFHDPDGLPIEIHE